MPSYTLNLIGCGHSTWIVMCLRYELDLNFKANNILNPWPFSVERKGWLKPKNVIG